MEAGETDLASIWLVADLDSDAGLALTAEALKFLVSKLDRRVNYFIDFISGESQFRSYMPCSQSSE
jgi:hypothetical protein